MNVLVPSGKQYSITHGAHHAVITSVGGAIRIYTVGDRPVFTGFQDEEVSPAFHGAVLLPWPNRLEDGAYTFDGKAYQVPISEPARQTALHGLACWHEWQLVHHDDTTVTVELALPPSPGYPFSIHSQITYRLGDEGLHVTVTTSNLGTQAAPFGIGFHPWLSPGRASLDECSLRLDAAGHVTVDHRLLPTGVQPVDDTTDWRQPRTLQGADLDDAFVDVTRDAQGRSWGILAAPDGHASAIWMDQSMDTWQVCTGNHIDNPALRRTGVAVEPMSCLANAFRTTDRLRVLAPGDTYMATWGATLLSMSS